jgi:hypothetical protein
MAILDSIGTSLVVGGQSVIHGTTVTLTSYIVESATDGGKEVDMEDINDADGALSTRLIFKRHAKVSLKLISKTGATPLVDFPQGDMSVHTGLTEFYVDSLSIENSKSAQRVTLELTDIGIT